MNRPIKQWPITDKENRGVRFSAERKMIKSINLQQYNIWNIIGIWLFNDYVESKRDREFFNSYICRDIFFTGYIFRRNIVEYRWIHSIYLRNFTENMIRRKFVDEFSRKKNFVQVAHPRTNHRNWNVLIMHFFYNLYILNLPKFPFFSIS